MAYNSAEIPLSSIYPYPSFSLTVSLCLSLTVSLCLSLTVRAAVLNQARNPIIIYLSVSPSISMSVSFHLFSLPLLHIPMAWIWTEIPFIRPSISLFSPPPLVPKPHISVSPPSPPRCLKAKLSIHLPTHPSLAPLSKISLRWTGRRGGCPVSLRNIKSHTSIQVWIWNFTSL